MIDKLEYLLPGFSKVDHTRCFLHINNLVAQTFVRQFDTPTKPKTSSRDNPDDPNNVLYELAKDINLEKRETCKALLKGAGSVGGRTSQKSRHSPARRVIWRGNWREVARVAIRHYVIQYILAAAIMLNFLMKRFVYHT
jgi:hypothetical protein